eukprot:TRINITY_DN8114_c0_g2_i1.p1 TRINITY_DN8114_c0_g2~~TRINITY_DN8114_c0_g2_i1.p1  ORF type:complete len:271 (+),score=48.97 TRINITY_DN8114_c0_g2_i1:47-859(+)
MSSLLGGGKVKGLLCDITGVLRESSSSGDGICINGSVEAIEELEKAGIQCKFVTNECQCTRSQLHSKLLRLGFSMSEESIMPPALAAKQFIKKNNLRPHLLVHPNVLPDFDDIDKEDPNCVVLGDAVDLFNYKNLNEAFRLIKEKNCEFISLGKGKYYREDGALTLDVGPFTAGLEFACGREAVVCGKPAPQFFQAGWESLGLTANDVVMVGDDIISDVGGAQKAGVRGVLVRTGKYSPSDETHPDVTPHLIVDNLKSLSDIIISHNQNL